MVKNILVELKPPTFFYMSIISCHRSKIHSHPPPQRRSCELPILLRNGRVLIQILVRLERHVLGDNVLHLTLHLALVPPMLNVAEAAEEGRESDHRVDHARGRHALLHLLRPAVRVRDALLLIRAARARGAHGGDRPTGVPRAYRLENDGELERATDRHAVDVHRGEDDHPALVLRMQLLLQEGVRRVPLQPPRVGHALVYHLPVDFRVRHRVRHALLVREVLLRVAPENELVDVIPPRRAHAVGLAVVTPDAHPPEALRHNISARYAAIEVVVRVRGAVPTVVRAEVVALVLPVLPHAAAEYAVVDV